MFNLYWLKNMKTYDQLLNNIMGQLNGVGRMIKNKEDCFQTLTQMKAARSALSSLMNKYMRENFQACLTQCKRKGEHDDVCKKFFDEIINNS